jgi:large subunit ribosomal protein L29
MAEVKEKVMASELRDRNDAELQSMLSEKVDELHGVKFKKALGQLAQSHFIKQLKQDIARLKTILNERTGQEA